MRYCVTALLLLFLSACSTMSVSHYDRNLWLENTPQTLTMRFWQFSYEGHSVQKGLGIRAVASPQPERLPDWARWYDQLIFTAYLSDTTGTVLAQSQTELLPRPISVSSDPAGNIPVEFFLPAIDHDGPLFVTFGYTMRLSEKQWKQGTPYGKVRLVKEGALSQ